MGQEASCCGNTEKTTRSGGKVTYGDKKKRSGIQDGGKAKRRRNRERDTNDSESTSKTTVCKDDF